MNIFDRNVLVAILLCTLTKIPLTALGMEAKQQILPDLSSKTTVKIGTINEELALSHLKRDLCLDTTKRFQFKSSTVTGMVSEVTEVFNRFTLLDNDTVVRFMAMSRLMSKNSNNVNKLYTKLGPACGDLFMIRIDISDERSKLCRRVCMINKANYIVSQHELQYLANDVIRALDRSMIFDDRVKLIEKKILICLLEDSGKKGSSVQETILFQPLLLSQHDVAIVPESKPDKLQLKPLVEGSAARLQLSIDAIKNCHKDYHEIGIDCLFKRDNQDTVILKTERFFSDLLKTYTILNKKEQELLKKIERLEAYSYAVRDSDICAEEQLLGALEEKLDSLNYEASITRGEAQAILDDAKLLKEKIMRMIEAAKKQKEDRDIATAIKKEMETAEKQMKQKELNKKIGAFIGKITGFFTSENGSTPH